MNGNYNLENIRMLLIEGFDKEDLRNLCFDKSVLRPVYDNWSESASKSELARRIVEYADRKVEIETVLDWARTQNPSGYEKYGPYKVVDARPSSSPPTYKPDSGGSRTTKIAMIGAALVLILATLLAVYSLSVGSRQSSTEAAKISEPIDGQNALTNPEVIVEYNNIPADRYLWVAVRIPKVRPTGLIYPQLKDMKLPPHLIGTGIYHTYAALGGKGDTGAPFNIIVLLANQEANDQITAYARACSFNVNSCTGMPLPETGIEILDFVTVIRQ